MEKGTKINLDQFFSWITISFEIIFAFGPSSFNRGKINALNVDRLILGRKGKG